MPAVFMLTAFAAVAFTGLSFVLFTEGDADEAVRSLSIATVCGIIAYFVFGVL